MKVYKMVLAVLMLTLVSIGAVAQVKVVFGEKGEEKFTGKGGTITFSQDTKGDEVTVTLTVTPDKGYTITKGDIKVYATYPPSGTRTLEIADNLTLYYNGSEKEDVKDPSVKRDYTFTVSSGFGAWVKEANFQPEGRKGGQESVVTITTTEDISNHTEKIYLIQSYNNEAFYLRTDLKNANKINTSNIVTENSEWYFKDATIIDGTQYYYIIHKSTNKYVWINNTTPQYGDAPTSGNEDKYRFSIVKNSTQDAYNIIPKNKSTSCLRKNTGNWQTTSVDLSNTFSEEQACWNFISKKNYTKPTVPFVASTLDGNKHEYQIQNNNNQDLYMIPGTTYVITSSTFTDENKRWFFVKAEIDDPYLDYYFIIHNTGKYLRHRLNNTESGENAVELADFNSSEQEPFLFIIVPGSNQNETHASTQASSTYCIAPKNVMVQRSENTVCLSTYKEKNNSSDNNGKAVKVFKERDANPGTHWNFIRLVPRCEPPIIAYSETDNNKIQITCATEDVTIYYNVNSTDNPTTDSTPYNPSEQITITDDMTIVKAYAVKNNASEEEYLPSSVTTFNLTADDPVITYDASTNTASIACSTPGATVYYTTTVDNTPTSTDNKYIKAISLEEGVNIIKAIAVKGGAISSTATCKIPVQTSVEGKLRPYLIRNNGDAWSDGNPFFYIIPDVINNNANTTSIPRPTMEWYFKDAGFDGNGNQCYYIVNAVAKSANEKDLYLYRNDNAVSIAEFNSSDDGFKFYLIEREKGYNIVPFGQSTNFLNKNSGNGQSYSLNLSNSQNADATNWNFVFKKDLDTSVPFEVSSYDDGVKFYKIRSNRTDGNLFYITMADSKANVSSAADEATQSWYFKEAGNDGWATYYNIVYAATGEYLYCTATKANTYNGGGSDNLTFELRPTNDERSQYIIAKSTFTDSYFIVPRLYKDAQYNNVCGILNRDDKYLRTDVTKARQITWKFEESGYTCVPPTIAYDKAHDGYIITSSLPELKIYYKINDDPAISADNLYTPGTVIPISLFHDNDVIKAFATNDNSGEGKSETVTHTVYKVATPHTEIASDGSIKLVSTTTGATIYYTLDGTDPTTASTHYVFPLTDASGKVIKAIAVKDGWIPSDIGGSGTVVTIQCATPVIKRGSNNTFTLECEFPAEGVTIYYTTEGTEPTTSSSEYTEPVATSFPVTIKAIAVAEGYANSAIAEKTITEGLESEGGYYLISSSGDFDIFVNMVNDDGANENYRVTDDFSVSSPGTITKDFTGIFDGGYHTISGLTKPLFAKVDRGTVKNLILSNVNITTGNNVGAICGEADGTAKIYNCGVLSGDISGSDNTGGLVGLIATGSSVRVVNCYNYASISGGSTKAGIVGKNDGAVGNVRIAMCMMYGDMSGGTSPVYAGNHTSNVSNFTEYNYYRSKANLTYTTYNDQLAIDKDEYLTRFPFYRHILNTHRELAAWFLFGISGSNVSSVTSEQVNEIGHWVLNTDIAPYPIIEAWGENTKKITEGIANNLPRTSEDYKGKLLTDMGSGGFLTVNVSINGKSYSSQLPITDMNKDKFDYTWGKVVLPFANEFEVNDDYSKVCTGWKITSVSGGKAGSYANYNMADRDCTTKDLYSTTGFIFAQGGNYVVPYGVTAINIEANFANAYYLSDEAYEIGYSGDKTNGDKDGYIGRIDLGGNMPNEYHGQTVYHTLAAALGAMSASGTTHSQAVVLVGNYHQDSENLSSLTANGLTIMSIDADNNQEPDYAWYSNNTQDRPKIPPTRFDFVALIPMGMSSRVNNSTNYPLIPIWKSCGWFELTETSLSTMEQFELDSGNFNTSENDTKNYRCIINGGYFTQMVRSRDGNCSKVKYYQIGGNAYIKEFYPGSHSAKPNTTTLVPINVTGGEIEQCFMTGYGKEESDTKYAKAIGSDIYFWCAGGKVNKFLGAYMERPWQTSNSAGNVNMTAKIDHALIGRFFGGGTSPKAQITGNIDVTINNSKVDFYCGGPEFGDMTSGKTVTTHATGTTFGEYYGAGFGGTAITYTNDQDNTTQGIGSATKPTVTYPESFFRDNYLSSDADKGRLSYKSGYGIGSCYKFEFIFSSRGNGSVARFYTGYAKFSLATTGSVTNILDDCILLHDFYGAGCQGKVNGTVSSTLTACTVNGSVFGGGYKAESNEVDVYPTTPPTMSVYTRETGIFSDFGTVAPETFTWAQGTAENNNKADGNILYTGTDVTLSELGNVTGAISLTINGGSVTGSVFGGGNESKSLNNTTVNIKGNSQITGDVYGGGNKADVNGSTTVNIQK